MLLAGRYDWSPPSQCLDTEGSGVIVTQIYSDAYHGFDQPGSRTYLGHVMVYDALATNAARNEVEKFLATELKR